VGDKPQSFQADSIRWTKAHNLQVGSYPWAKGVAAQAADLELALTNLAALTGKPLGVIREQVAELARATRTDSMVIVSHLEYSYHYGQTQRLCPPAREMDRRTVHLNGKPYHWTAALGGQLRLTPGESPW
jgi:hypothetical protein